MTYTGAKTGLQLLNMLYVFLQSILYLKNTYVLAVRYLRKHEHRQLNNILYELFSQNKYRHHEVTIDLKKINKSVNNKHLTNFIL